MKLPGDWGPGWAIPDLLGVASSKPARSLDPPVGTLAGSGQADSVSDDDGRRRVRRALFARRQVDRLRVEHDRQPPGIPSRVSGRTSGSVAGVEWRRHGPCVDKERQRGCYTARRIPASAPAGDPRRASPVSAGSPGDRRGSGVVQDFLPGTVGTASSDGQRFLLFTRPGDDGERNQNPLTVVNWQAALD